MDPKTCDVVSAFTDGEVVDPDEFAAALTDPEALDLLVTVASIRAELAEDTSQPSPAFEERLREVIANAERRQRFFRRGPRVPWPLAAGFAVAAR